MTPEFHYLVLTRGNEGVGLHKDLFTSAYALFSITSQIGKQSKCLQTVRQTNKNNNNQAMSYFSAKDQISKVCSNGERIPSNLKILSLRNIVFCVLAGFMSTCYKL